jgi:phycobilisome core-membrane linker protein
LGPKVFRLNNELPGSSNGVSVKFGESSTQRVILAAYRQVFGRMPYEGQRLSVAQIKLENGDITLRRVYQNPS